MSNLVSCLHQKFLFQNEVASSCSICIGHECFQSCIGSFALFGKLLEQPLHANKCNLGVFSQKFDKNDSGMGMDENSVPKCFEACKILLTEICVPQHATSNGAKMTCAAKSLEQVSRLQSLHEIETVLPKLFWHASVIGFLAHDSCASLLVP